VTGRTRIWGFAVALAALTPVFAAPAVADSCTKLSGLVLPEVISITATSIAADSFTPPGLTTPVPVAFCRVQITVTPARNYWYGCSTGGRQGALEWRSLESPNVNISQNVRHFTFAWAADVAYG
jgi:hypothetical protein